ncbi:ATP synthase F0F1 subunit delta [Buchnera aphidicola (Diuraphis noxia)]|uniref:ATP synthase subunit delta n=1 Tax=Buchnera aphidicola subsp. Diuraphis noxia TaxID=118101 RepID=A0A1B2H7Q8_BUCDN|nr:F0F1 ATP synthase subunit delta [Buchnera aphidicola]ANZ22261.1 ATP synthase F0F1 subunit delta [Buchnera aphidicola (Diuraphis noxia)]
MSVADTIARPYARAIFEIAVYKNSMQKWKEFLIFINDITADSKIRILLSKSFSPKYLSSVFIEICGNLDEEKKNLIKLLCENQRFNVITNILNKFLKLEADYKNILIVELISSCSLEQKQIFQIQTVLEKRFLKKIQFLCKVNHDLLDGIVLKINNTVVDLSIRNYIQQLSNVLDF